MDKFSIEGPSRIKGEVEISGSKNSSLPILAATLLFNQPVVLKNLPKVNDINTMISLLRSLGSKIILSKDKRVARIYNKKNLKTFASYSLVKTMRGSILVLGPLIARYYKSKISLPGGCLIGARPINYHLDSLKKLGMSYILKNGYILAKSKGKLKGIDVTMGAVNFEFIGGAHGQNESEAIIFAAEHATKNQTPLILMPCGGGQVMFQGARALVGMTRTTVAVSEFKKNTNLPYIVVFHYKCAGGITASYAHLSAIAIAENENSEIIFAGRRVIEGTIKEELPSNFQKASWALEKGFIDNIIDRKDLPEKLSSLLSILLNKKSQVSSENNEQTQNLTINSEEELEEYLDEYCYNDDVCPEIYEPVCGSDGVTYSNYCYAESAGVFDYSTEACDDDSEGDDSELETCGEIISVSYTHLRAHET